MPEQYNYSYPREAFGFNNEYGEGHSNQTPYLSREKNDNTGGKFSMFSKKEKPRPQPMEMGNQPSMNPGQMNWNGQRPFAGSPNQPNINPNGMQNPGMPNMNPMNGLNNGMNGNTGNGMGNGGSQRMTPQEYAEYLENEKRRKEAAMQKNSSPYYQAPYDSGMRKQPNGNSGYSYNPVNDYRNQPSERQDTYRQPHHQTYDNQNYIQEENIQHGEESQPVRLNCSLETEMVLVFSLVKGMNFGDETVIGMRPTLARAELAAMEKLGYDLEKMRTALKL